MALAIGASFLLISSVLANPIDQHVLSSTHQTSEQTIEYHVPKQLKSPPQSRKIQGRFLHITDPFFKSNSATDNSCHSGKGSAGLLGAAASDCDSPVSLINATFQWIEDNIKDDIDFVIWTGDSARHDNDEDIPRTQEQVISLNELMVSKFEEVFGVDDTDPTSDFSIPIVPTFGNNDILPHNILEDGPNRWTRKYSSLWKKFIPEVQRHTFAKKKNNKNSKQEKREEFLSKIGGKWAERFSLTLVSPSIVPNYYPTLRIIEYNITGLEHETIPSSWREHVPPFDVQADMGDFLKQTDGDLFAVLSDTVDAEKKGKKKKKKGKDKDKKRKPKYKIPKSPSSTSPPGPGYSPQSLSLLSYTQYYANITKIDSDISAAASLEESQAAYNSKSKDGLVRDFFHFEIEYDTRNYSKRFEMEDLTVRSYLHLAKNIGKRKGNKAAGLDVDGPIWFEHEHNSAFEDEDVHHWSESQQQELIELEEGHSSTREAKALKPTPTAELDDEVVDRITNLESISPEDATVDIDKKHKKKKKKKHKKNEIWFTFLKRAFVGTKDDDELKDVFGSN
ncbi:putative vacuolar endopolyphosphatase [Phaeomoniella chlamydospora]|uniref:Putative vacuolar endopolyphosphatase n=1 Tax=Phaeomoniella chlamydospora TaxID=158046 RepID=A0A0G2GK60_PHACM|nr:putative vacuolar endopolyphosphatase [Phaeomoniella chlamydospora]